MFVVSIDSTKTDGGTIRSPKIPKIFKRNLRETRPRLERVFQCKSWLKKQQKSKVNERLFNGCTLVLLLESVQCIAWTKYFKIILFSYNKIYFFIIKSSNAYIYTIKLIHLHANNKSPPPPRTSTAQYSTSTSATKHLHVLQANLLSFL